MQQRVVEIYRNEGSVLLDNVIANTGEVPEKFSLYKKLGFNALSSRRERPERFYQQMSKVECEIWRAFLPTSYSRKDGDWSTFVFDSVPVEVLKEIRYAVSLNIFDDILIRTSETYNDPLVYGLVRTGRNTCHAYTIARWGESLMDFSEICRELMRRAIYYNQSDKEIVVDSLLSLWMEKIDSGSSLPFIYIKGLFSLSIHCSTMMRRVHIRFPYHGSSSPLGHICLECGQFNELVAA